MRPIVEIMTVNFSLLALDQIMNNAATLLHMSGGQCNVPLVIRMTTGAGRQVAAQHSHSLEGWYAHIPGLRILAPATVEDARGMLWPALDDPDPVLIFEHAGLYNTSAQIADGSRARSTSRAPRCAARAPTSRLITYGGTLPITLDGRRTARGDGRRVPRSSTCGRCGRSTTRRSSTSVRRTHRAVVVDEGWRSGSISAEISARIMEQAFYDLDAPVERVCGAEVPMPYAKHLEEAALPERRGGRRRGDADAVQCLRSDGVFRMPSLGADMDSGTVLEWLVHPGDTVHRGDLVAVVKTDKADIEVEIFEDGVIGELLVPEGTEVDVGTPLATLAGATAAHGDRRHRRPPPVPHGSTPVAARRRLAPVQPPAPAPTPASRPSRPADRTAVVASRRTRAGARAELGVDLDALAPAAARAPDHRGRRRAGRDHGRGAACRDARRSRVDQAAAMRRAIGNLMARSKREIPHYYLEHDISLTHTLAWLAQPQRGRPGRGAGAARRAVLQGGRARGDARSRR